MADLPNLTGFLSDPKYAAPAYLTDQPATSAPSGLGALVAGFKAGGLGAGAAITGAASGAAKLVGADDASASLGRTAEGLTNDARQVSGGLDSQGFFDKGLGGFANKALYTAGSIVPQVGAAIGGAALAGAALPEEAVAGVGLGLGRLGASLPKLLGGAGVGAGFAEGAAPAVLNAGLRTATGVVGAGGVMGIQSAGDQVNEAAKQEGGLTRGNAAKAFALGLPIGLVQGIAPADALGGAAAGAASAVSRAATRGFKDAAANAVGSGLQAAAETSYDPNLSAEDRAKAIVSAVASGAAVGGLMAVGLGLAHRPGDTSGVDTALKGVGMDPADPAGTQAPAPTPPPAPAPPAVTTNAVQQELPLQRPPIVAGDGAQLGLPGFTTAEGPVQPYNPGRAPARDDASLMAALQEAQGRTAAAEPEPTPVPAATLKEALAQTKKEGAAVSVAREVANGVGIRMGKGQSAFGDFVRASTAADPVELHNEIRAVDPTSKLAQDPRFTKLADAVGVDDTNALEAQLAKLTANPETADVKAIGAVHFRIGVRDAAARARAAEEAARAPEAAPVAEAAPAPVDASAAPVDEAQPQLDLSAAVDEPAPSAGNTAVPVQAPEFRGAIPGLETPETADVPAVRPPREALQDEDAPAPTAALQAGTEPTLEAGPTPDAETPPTRPSTLATSREDGSPLSIVERVTDLARSTLDNPDAGGQVSISQLKDVARKQGIADADLTRALQDIHADDTDTSLVQAPKGQRNGVDGVTVAGLGKHHFLELEPRTPDAVQERSAAPPDAGDAVPGAVRGDGEGNAAQAAGAVLEGRAPEEGLPGQAGADEAPAPQPEVAAGRDPATGLPLTDSVTGKPFDLTKVRDRRLAKVQGDAADAQAARAAADTAEVQRKADFAAQVDAAPRQQLDRFDQTDASHPIVGLKNQGVDYLNSLPDRDLAELQKSYGKDTAALRNEIGGSSNPRKTLDFMRTEVEANRARDVDAGLQARDAATQVKLAPERTVEPKSDGQLALDLQKSDATGRLLTAPDALADPVVKKLRRATKAKTSLIETPAGDQLPTQSVGSSLFDLPQAKASVPDAAPPAKRRPPILKSTSAETPVPPLPREQVQAHFDKIVAKLSPDVRERIELVRTGHPIPDGPPMEANSQGLYADGRVYINADTMRSLADVESTISHEVFGHLGNMADLGGLSGTFNESRYNARMAGVLQRAGGVKGLEALARRAGVWSDREDGGSLRGSTGVKDYFPQGGREPTPAEAAMMVDELIAHAAERNTGPTELFIRQVQARLKQSIASTLKAAGLPNFAKRFERFGQPELASWLADTRRALTEQPGEGKVDMVAGATSPRHFVNGVEPTGRAPFMARMAGKQQDTEGLMGYVGSAFSRFRDVAPIRALFGEAPVYGRQGPSAAERATRAAQIIQENLATSHGIAQEFKRVGGGDHLATVREADKGRQTAHTMLNGPANRVAQDHMNIGRVDRQRRIDTDDTMHFLTTNRIDPERPWEEHTWLRDGATAEQVAKSQAAHAEGVKMFNKLGQDMKGGRKSWAQQVVRDQIKVSKYSLYMREVEQTHDALKASFGDKVAGYDPIKRATGQDSYVDPATNRPLVETLRDNVDTSLAHMKGEFDRLRAAGKAELERADGLADKRLAKEAADAGLARREGDVEAARSAEHVQLAKRLEGMDATERNQINAGPYFRLGRSGEHGVSVSLKGVLDAQGQPTAEPTPAALAALKAATKDFSGVTFSASSENRKIFARFESAATAENFHNLFAEGGALREHVDISRGTWTGLLSHAEAHDDAIPFLRQQIESLMQSYDKEIAKLPPNDPRRAVMAEQRSANVAVLRQHALDLAGDSSMASLQANRENVLGARADMVQNQKTMAASYARSVSAAIFRGEIAENLAAARARIEAVGRSGKPTATKDAARMQRVLDAFESRRAAAEVRPGNTLLDTIRSGLHTYQLGGSFGYAMLNMGQLGNLTLPELIRAHSAARAVPAMIGATGSTMKVLRAMWTNRVVNADGSKGARNLFEGGITKAVMDAANLSEKDRLSLSHLVNHGHIEMDGFANVNSGLGVGNLSGFGQFRHYVNSTAQLTETAARLISAFSAMKLHDQTVAAGGPKAEAFVRKYGTREQYAGHVINESMMGWGGYETPKIMTAGGAAGSLGPLAGQFHGWVPRLAEKLYRETRDAWGSRLIKELGPEAGAQAKKEAQRFMFAHLALTMSVAGGLGLPLGGYLAGAATKLSGLVLNQPYDVEQHLRNGLDDWLGKGVGEIVARGLPRYLGVDMSDLGDDNLGPFASLIEDRRKFEDAFPDYLAHAWGSAPSTLLNATIGARDIAEGRFSEGLARSMPTAIRNVVRAYRVNKVGYVSASGDKLPISAGAGAVLATALGFTPGDLAEERERQNALYGLRDDRQYRVNGIRKDYTVASNAGDQEGIAAATQRALQYDRDNPGLGLTAKLPQLMKSKAMQAAYAAQYGTMGLTPKDQAARGLLNQ